MGFKSRYAGKNEFASSFSFSSAFKNVNMVLLVSSMNGGGGVTALLGKLGFFIGFKARYAGKNEFASSLFKNVNMVLLVSSMKRGM